MKVDKMSVSFDPELGDQIRESARRSGGGLSRWLAEAAQEKLRGEAFDAFLTNWEAEHGGLTPTELAEAHRRLGLGGRSGVSAA